MSVDHTKRPRVAETAIPADIPGEPRKTLDLDIPKSDAVRALCNDLAAVRTGFANLGLQSHLIDRVIDKLKEQDAEITRIKSDRAYVTGFNEGWENAMMTGLPGGSG